MSEKLQVLDAWMDRVWENEDETAIDDMLVGDTKARGLGSQIHVGPEAFKGFHRQLLSLIGNVKIDIDKTLEDGEWLSTLVTLKAKRRDNGKPVQTTGHIFSKIQHGKIVDAYNHFDFMSLFEQCDLLPEKTMDRCLSCEKIA